MRVPFYFSLFLFGMSVLAFAQETMPDATNPQVDPDMIRMVRDAIETNAKKGNPMFKDRRYSMQSRFCCAKRVFEKHDGAFDFHSET